MNKIAVIGWGSLIWERRPKFDGCVDAWQLGGPRLPVEFCRKSSSRKNALTLVIDFELGTEVETYYAMSRRDKINDVVKDLTEREGPCIGYVDRFTGHELGNEKSIDILRKWLELKHIDGVVWTDWPSNIEPQERANFFDSWGLEYLKKLDADGVKKAVEYIVNAPPETATRFRASVTDDEWFKAQRLALEAL